LSKFRPTSLFSDILNMWRRCGLIGIDNSACQSQLPIPARSQSILTDSRLHETVKRLMMAEISELPCFDSVNDIKTKPILQVFEPRFISAEANELEEFVNRTNRGDVEYLRLDQEVFVRRQPFREFWKLKVRGHVRHDVRRDKYSLIGEIAIIDNPVAECSVS
ncbi:hypothetical protein PFISCL1PPCAC_14456, partial [Pristionchus fissidentatus]